MLKLINLYGSNENIYGIFLNNNLKFKANSINSYNSNFYFFYFYLGFF